VDNIFWSKVTTALIDAVERDEEAWRAFEIAVNKAVIRDNEVLPMSLFDPPAPAPKAEPAPKPGPVPAMSFKQFCQRNGITKGAIDSRRKEQKAGYPWPDMVKVGGRVFVTFDAEKDYRVAAKVPLLAEPPVADIWL